MVFCSTPESLELSRVKTDGLQEILGIHRACNHAQYYGNSLAENVVTNLTNALFKSDEL